MPSYTDKIGAAVRNAAGQIAERLGAYAQAVPPVRGVGNQFAAPQVPRDEKARRIIESREALGGRVGYHAGSVPSWINTYAGGLTPQRIRAIHNEVRVSGWMVNKASLDEETLLSDAHLHAADSTFRDRITGCAYDVAPSDDTELALHIADYQLAVTTQMDSYQESCRRNLGGNAFGYAVEEAIFDVEPAPLRCQIGGEDVEVWGHHPRKREQFSNKLTRWDVSANELLIDTGRGTGTPMPPHKFVAYEASGSFQTRLNGYMFPGIWLHLLKSNATARWGVLLEIWGLPVPWVNVDYAAWQDATRRSEYEAMLADAGLGKPILTTDDIKIDKAFEISSGDARGMHAALVGWATTEQSKLVLGSSLTQEIGGPGSYALGTVHAETTEIRVANCARRLSETEARWHREFLKFAIYEVNADGSLGEVNPRGLCGVLSTLHGRKVTPEEILSKCGTPYWRIQREMTPQVRMDLYSKAVNDLGLLIDEDAPYREFGFRKPRRKTDRVLRGKTQVLADTDRTAPSVGATPPKPQQLDLDLAAQQAA